jgi:hypothetical protein
MNTERRGGVNWKLVQRDHVAQACELISKSAKSARASGLFVLVKGKRLPAKDVARTAYLLAIGKPIDTPIKFASGQGTLDMLQRLGFQVERNAPERRASED